MHAHNYTRTDEMRKKTDCCCCRFSSSSAIDRNHSDIKVIVKAIGVVQNCILNKHCLILSTGGVGDGDIVAQDGYSLQSERRTPGDEDSSCVDGDHSEITD